MIGLAISFLLPWLVGIEKSPFLFHNKYEGNGKLASQSVFLKPSPGDLSPGRPNLFNYIQSTL
jgi:hypothetical protein